MKLYAVRLVLLVCLAFPVYAPEAQDTAGGSKDPIDDLTTVTARQEALAVRLRSVRELREANDLLKAAQVLNEAGRLQLKLNLPQESLATFQESLALTDQLPLTDHVQNKIARVDALNGAAAAYLHSGKYEDARPLIQQAITASEQNNYVLGRAEAMLLLSVCENFTNHSQALKTANDALALWKTIGNTRGIIRSHLRVATYQYAQNSLD